MQFATTQKNLSLLLDSRLKLIEHIDNQINKYNKFIGMMKIGSLTPSTKISLTKYNKNCPSLMLNDGKVQFATKEEHLVIDFRFQT